MREHPFNTFLIERLFKYFLVGWTAGAFVFFVAMFGLNAGEMGFRGSISYLLGTALTTVEDIVLIGALLTPLLIGGVVFFIVRSTRDSYNAADKYPPAFAHVSAEEQETRPGSGQQASPTPATRVPRRRRHRRPRQG